MMWRWEKEVNEYARRKRRRAHSGKDCEVVKHMISQEVFDFIKTKDILHKLIHPHSIGKENIPLNSAQTYVIPRPPQDFSMDSLVEDMDSLLEPIVFDSLTEDMDSLLEPIAFDSLIEDMDSLLEPITFDMLIEDMDSLLEPIAFDSLIEDMDSLLEPITLDSLTEDMDSLLEPIMVEDMDSLLEPIVVEDMDSLLEQPIAFSNSSNVDEFNEIVCRLDSILEPVVLVERC